MNETTVSSPTDSGCAGLSRPVCRKGIVLASSSIFGVAGGMEVEIIHETNDNAYYVVMVSGHVQLIPKEMIEEVSVDV